MAETRVGGARIRYDDVGQGEPTLLFIPGWCTSREVFRKLVPWCSMLHRALVVDLPGHGESQQPGPDFDNTAVVDTLRAVIDASGARQVVPVALSHGGWWALELRRQLGSRIPALVLLDWLVLEPPPPFLQAVQALQSSQWRQARDGLFSLWLQGVSSPDVVRFVRDDMGSFGEDMWKRGGREIEKVYSRYGSPLEALATLSPPVPTLHLYAQPEDKAWLEAQGSFASSHPWFQVQKLPARSHFPLLELPEDMAARIGRFLDSTLGTHPARLAPPPT
ncbi:alpha/beta fold hydrolase [Archangium violaceum]|uniref:3-hydroxy-4-oxoquinoline 2,4-dioxygenase n=1 Tax=Archangium violaceum Cb vi76 TaxID=1406225 RepID=A0A084STQ7_9BACT|nr:alpha/beta hydrolase [Archangium violaceum]KFA91842.1 3-hydroxy-4-oxoquinoline 2,4-dioxygenase [Archangium violaceum Cb vi76]